MLMAQCQQLYELWKKAVLIKGKKTQESSRALEARVAMLEAITDNSCNESIFPNERHKANNRNNPALDRKRSGTRQSNSDSWGSLKEDSQPSVLWDGYVKPIRTIQVMVAHASVANSKPKVELDSHADMCVVGDNCLVIHDTNRTVNVYSYVPKDSHQNSWCHNKVSRSTEWTEVYLSDKPKTVMSAKTSYISQFWRLEWFKWVMFQDETALFPDDLLKLGCYLGPSIDVGPAMTAKILMENGQVLHRSTCRSLTSHELLDKDGPDAQD